jgi:hypothetical protein
MRRVRRARRHAFDRRLVPCEPTLPRFAFAAARDPGAPRTHTPPRDARRATLPAAGAAQGAFIRRHQIPKPPSAGGGSGSGFYTEHDLYVGATLNVYNKVFEIYDCNDSTRAFLAQDLMLPPDKFMAAPSPEGEYNSMLRSKMQRETGADLSIKRNRKMHPMKMFMEAQLGKPQSAVDLGSFLANDRKVLRFDCVWDDTSRLYGDVLQFKLHYFLSDDTMEILQVSSLSIHSSPVSSPVLSARHRSTTPTPRMTHTTDTPMTDHNGP